MHVREGVAFIFSLNHDFNDELSSLFNLLLVFLRFLVSV